MAIKKTQEKNLMILMSIIAILVMVGIVQVVITQQNKDAAIDENNVTVNNIEEDNLNGNKIVIQNENSYSAEGSNLPSDVNWDSILPDLLTNDKLVGVVDNGQVDARNITLKYKLKGTLLSNEQQLLGGFTNLNWNMNKGQDGSFRASQNEKYLYMDLEEVDPETVYATLLVNLPKADMGN
ncbi:hypothetical protein KBD45_01925 [Candidatus Dojkabacteria bacterium]|nr:hypothetical protein [Candidatus Dojkabacteria bacterium]